MIYLIVGASAGLGRCLSQQLASLGHDLILISSSREDLKAMASDLKIRHRIKVEIIPADISAGDEYLDEVEKIIKTMKGLDGIFCPVGAVSDSDDLCLYPARVGLLTNVNYMSVASLITRLWPFLTQQPRRTVVVGFGSIAAVRGRSQNIAYSAAKRALMSFFESLRHAAATSQVVVQFYILGYLDTNQAFGKKTLLPRAKLERLCRKIVDNLQKDFGATYYPRYWSFIALLLKLTPWFLFKRLTF
jgi:short-subunit dehydrogenase